MSDQTSLPVWAVTLIGRMTVEAELSRLLIEQLREQLAAAQQAPEPDAR